MTAAAAPYGGKLPAAAAIVKAARRRAGALWRGAGARGEADKQLVLAADQFVIETRRPDRRRRLSVVRRVVARPDDVVRGPLPLDAAASTRGARRCAGRRRPSRRACSRTRPTRGRSSTTPPTARSGSSTRSGVTSSDRRRRPRRRARAGAGRDRRRATSRARASASASTRRRPPAAGRGRLGADLDGRAHRRRAGDAADREAGRGERALDRSARHRGPARERDGPRDGAARRGARSSFLERFVRRRRRRAARRGRRARRATTPPCGRTSCSPSRSRTARSREVGDAAAASSPPAGRC